MSFYNVTNPTTFQVLDLIGRQGTFKQSALQRADSTQLLSANTTLTAQQVIAGVLFIDTSGGARTLTLPSAAVLLAALNSGVYASQPVSTNDVIFITIVAYGDGTNAVTFQTAGGATSTTVAARTSEQVGIRFTNVTAGSETMIVLN
jgi:hypothetical protein